MPKIIKGGLISLWLFLSLSVFVRAEVVLVQEGKPCATIIISEYALEPAKLAASELQNYVKKITGVTLAIVRDDEEITGPKILVGESEFTRKLGLKNEDFKPQEYLIRTSGNDLILMGRDESNNEALKLPATVILSVKYYYQKIGSIYAVDTFLEKYCGVRWYMPAEIGEVVPKKTTLEFGIINLRRQLSVRHRDVSFSIPLSLWTWKDKPFSGWLSQTEDLWWKRRMKLTGSEPYISNHSLYGYYARFGKSHPEWFADGNPTLGNILCFSNPEVFQQVVQDARDYFDGKLKDEGARAMGDVFAVMPMDTRYWCMCEKCKPKYDESRKRKGVFNNGYTSDYVWDFVSKVASEVAKTHLGKFISCGAYWDYAEPPKNVDIPDNVKVQICIAHVYWFYPEQLKSDTDIITGWAKKLKNGENLYIWDYYLFPEYNTYNIFPSIASHAISKIINTLKSVGATGGFKCEMSEIFNIGLEHLRLYITMKLLDDWDQDVDVILNEYYKLFYGPAEKPMKEFFERIDNTFYDTKKIKPFLEGKIHPQVPLQDPRYSWTKLCPPEELEKYGKLIEEAKAKSEKDSIYRRRVELIEESLYKAIMIQSSKATLADLGEDWDSALPGMKKVE